jgi:muramoyltetrapeptide carboxypeptidase
LSARKPIRKPYALRKGDLIGIVAPASPISHRRLEEGTRELEAIGFRVAVHPHVFQHDSFYAGSHPTRLAALLEYLEAPEIRAIFCNRGGYGSDYVVEQMMAPTLFHKLQRMTPKIVVGYSDLTSLLLFLNQSLGWVSFQGPLVSKDIAGGEMGYDHPLMEQVLSGTKQGATVENSALTLRPGIAEGRLTGGCLSMMVHTLGTPREIDTAGSILLIEDVNEKPYRIDRMLFHLRRAGKFSRIKAVVFGQMPGCTLGDSPVVALREVIFEAFEGLQIPVVFGMPFGHNTGRCLTLPLGVKARLSAGNRVQFKLLEPAVQPTPKKSTGGNSKRSRS